jgi:hypothetical protein
MLRNYAFFNQCKFNFGDQVPSPTLQFEVARIPHWNLGQIWAPSITTCHNIRFTGLLLQPHPKDATATSWLIGRNPVKSQFLKLRLALQKPAPSNGMGGLRKEDQPFAQCQRYRHPSTSRVTTFAEEIGLKRKLIN